MEGDELAEFVSALGGLHNTYGRVVQGSCSQAAWWSDIRGNTEAATATASLELRLLKEQSSAAKVELLFGHARAVKASRALVYDRPRDGVRVFFVASGVYRRIGTRVVRGKAYGKSSRCWMAYQHLARHNPALLETCGHAVPAAWQGRERQFFFRKGHHRPGDHLGTFPATLWRHAR